MVFIIYSNNILSYNDDINMLNGVVTEEEICTSLENLKKKGKLQVQMDWLPKCLFHHRISLFHTY